MLHRNATQSPTPIRISGVALRSTSAIERLSDTAPRTITLTTSAAWNPLSCNRRALTPSAKSTAAIGTRAANPARLKRRRAGSREERIGMSLKTFPPRAQPLTTFRSSSTQGMNLARNDLRLDSVDVLADVLWHSPPRLVVVREFHHVGVLQSKDDVGGWERRAVLYSRDDSLDALGVVGEVSPEDVVRRGRGDVGEDAESANIGASLAYGLDHPDSGGVGVGNDEVGSARYHVDCGFLRRGDVLKIAQIDRAHRHIDLGRLDPIGEAVERLLDRRDLKSGDDTHKVERLAGIGVESDHLAFVNFARGYEEPDARIVLSDG